MDSRDEEFYGSTSFITKGRRTKRQRTTTTITSSNDDGRAGYVETGYASSTTDDHDVMSDITTEEEDMANCLILLAQGITKKRSYDNIINTDNKTNTSIRVDNNSNVYECKTCNKTFPSFQALGGHRTSHKSNKSVSQPPLPAPSTVRPPCNSGKPRRIHNNLGKTTRVHECTICGSEFPSGQALGGHMRRHRQVVSTSTAVIELDETKNFLSLDLNLPAPQDDDESHMVETKFHVLATPVLVDCHH